VDIDSTEEKSRVRRRFPPFVARQVVNVLADYSLRPLIDHSRRRRRCRRRFFIALVRFRIIAKTTTTTRKIVEHEERGRGDVRTVKGEGKRTNKRARMPSLYLFRARDNTLRPIRGTPNDRWKLPAFAARATRPNACSTCKRILWRASFRILSVSPFYSSCPSVRPSTRARSKTSASLPPIGGDGDGGGCGGLVFLLSLALRSNHFTRLFTSSM